MALDVLLGHDGSLDSRPLDVFQCWLRALGCVQAVPRSLFWSFFLCLFRGVLDVCGVCGVRLNGNMFFGVYVVHSLVRPFA